MKGKDWGRPKHKGTGCHQKKLRKVVGEEEGNFVGTPAKSCNEVIGRDLKSFNVILGQETQGPGQEGGGVGDRRGGGGRKMGIDWGAKKKEQQVPEKQVSRGDGL